MGILRRDILRLSAGLAALPVASRLAFADTYPSRPVRVLVATSAGGSTDIIGRLVALYLTEKLGQPFFVENRPGGGNNIGTEMAAHSPPDGYTLFMANSVNAINNSLYENLNYVFMNDFVPIVNTMTSPCLMMVHPSVPAKTAAEFIALAKANPGTINMGSGGVGSTGHLGGELLQMMAGIKLAHVPYRGEAPAMTDLIAGHCQMVIATTGSAMEYCKAGSVRAIAVTLDMKLDALPDVKPLSDSAAWLHGHRLERSGRAEKRTGRHSRAAPQARQRRPRPTEHQAARHRHGRRGARWHGCRLRTVHG